MIGISPGFFTAFPPKDPSRNSPGVASETPPGAHSGNFLEFLLGIFPYFSLEMLRRFLLGILQKFLLEFLQEYLLQVLQ